jgi:hypothetical protein
LDSAPGSDICSFCAPDFYLVENAPTNATSIFQNPSEYCLSCPLHAVCAANTSLDNLSVKPNHWRYSINTSKLYRCKGNNTTCVGTAKMTTKFENAGKRIRKDNLDDYGTGMYCQEGHTGPLCEVCVKNDHYFSISNRRCTKCPSPAPLAVQFLGIIFGAIMVITIVFYLLKRRIQSFLSIVTSLSPQAKLKLLVSFYQLLSSLENVYGVTVSSELTNWMKVFQNFLTLDFIRITGMPMSCIGPTKQQLLINALWPFMLIIVGGYCFLAYLMVQRRNKLRRQQVADGQNTKFLQQDNLTDLLKNRSIQLTIIVLYFALPMVSQSIFDAIKCRAFQTNDDTPIPAFQSHLLMDMSIICDIQKDSKYGSILATFWSLFTIWIILIPLAFIALLKHIGPSVRSNSITFMADACRFLWQDYDASMWFWDIVDTYRKIFLTGAIIFIDTQEGSNKMLRLVVAIIVSMIYFGILLAYHPYKRSDDYNLAFLSNFLIISCFVLGIILKLCTDDDDMNQYDDSENSGTCNRFIGLSLDSYKASILVVTLSLGMLLVTAGVIIMLAINKITAPTVRMVSSGDAPDLELPEHCNFHVFMSHVWGTGQAKTHAITRKLQLFLPGLKVWLDVDELDDISKLEESVAETAVFILYYSKGYFKSKNCRREIYAAMKLDKPVILLYEGDESVLMEMEEECMSHCDSNNGEQDCPGAVLILEKLLGHADPRMHGPIQWLNEGSFSAAAQKCIYSRILRNLPCYKRHPDLLSEEQGIRVPGELGPISLESPINLIVCENNYGCSDVVEELKMILQNQGESASLITTIDARMILRKNAQQETDSLLDDNEDMSMSKAEIPHDPSLASPHIMDIPTFFLLYLNDNTFEGSDQDQNQLTSIIQTCIDDSDISIVLVHEKDAAKGGCDFGDFFAHAPAELIKPPNNLFRDIAIPLYSTKEYRILSLRHILCKMGATLSKNDSRDMLMLRTISNVFSKVLSRGGDHVS